ncbi:hypothetical protein FBU59_006762 [Linderina macrospora]|uniref:Uncharacterized protein n=1 Tax=Linderina macrospora TaxID=4868 RepID=A0ACC1IZA2_9FUNG|nr:hypothetical protein FBU59_006762 [Linderina macrospora]
MYRDYENRLREIEALPTDKDQEAEWQNILREEQDRRLALIRESSRPAAQSSRMLQPPPQMYHQTPTPMQQRPHGAHEAEAQRDDDSEMSVNLSPEP